MHSSSRKARTLGHQIVITAGANAPGQRPIIGAHTQAVPGQVLGGTLPGFDISIFSIHRVKGNCIFGTPTASRFAKFLCPGRFKEKERRRAQPPRDTDCDLEEKERAPGPVHSFSRKARTLGHQM